MFNNTQSKAPAGYVAGLGRGAVGFITRSDIGPSRTADSGSLLNQNQPPPQDPGDYSDAKYDEWSGFNERLFTQGDYDDEDREADGIYGMVERHLDGRRKQRRELVQQKQMSQMQTQKPSIQDQFKDLKRGLSSLSQKDWEGIPEMQDYSIKKQKKEKYTPLSDNLVARALGEGQVHSTINVTSNDGIQSSIGDINEIGSVRQTIFNTKMNSLETSVAGKSSLDKQGYMTALDSVQVNNSEEIGDMKKARLIMKSAITANPTSASSWIAAARIEEYDGKMDIARNLLERGLEHCGDNEDLWLEAARLEKQEKQKSVIAKGVSCLPQSIKLWQEATRLEQEVEGKVKVLKRALENLPGSVSLWKSLISLGDENQAKKLLYHAVECVPSCLELWISLAKLETYDNARVVLNKARQALPLEHSIWIYAAMLEESEQKPDSQVELVLSRGIKILQKNGQSIKRDDFLESAMECEGSANLKTCRAIINVAMPQDLEEDEKFRTLLDEAEHCENRQKRETARALYTLMRKSFPKDPESWHKGIKFETRMLQNNQKNELDELLAQATDHCPQTEDFWLMLARRQQVVKQDHESARKTLQKSIQVNPNNEKLILAYSKFEKVNGEIDSARKLLEQGRQNCKGIKLWTRSIKFEIEQKNIELATNLCEQAFALHQKNDKLWNLSADLAILQNNVLKARSIFEKALQMNRFLCNFRTSVRLWMAYSGFERDQGNISRARSILEKARSLVNGSEELWYQSCVLELKTENSEAIHFMISKSLQQMPNSGLIWALAVEQEKKRTRKAKIVDAMKKGENDPLIVLSIAKIFWREKKMDKARKWLERSLALDPTIGDTWAYYWTFVYEQDGEEPAELIKQKCIQQDPKKGVLWMQIRKNKYYFYGREKIQHTTEEILNILVQIIEEQLNLID